MSDSRPSKECDALIALKYDTCECTEKCEPCRGVRQKAIDEIERLQRERDDARADLAHREKYWAQFDHYPKGSTVEPKNALPKVIYQDLWDHLHEAHGLTLTQSEVEDILQLIPKAIEPQKATYVAERNRCDCHPETCCCDDYRLLKDGVVIASGRNDLSQIAALLNRTTVPPAVELEVARGLKVMGSPDAIKKAQVKITFAEEMMDACIYLGNAIPVRGFRDNAARVRAAADELLRLRSTQPPETARIERLVSAFKQCRADLALQSGTWTNAAGYGLTPEDIGLERIDEDAPVLTKGAE